MKKACVIGGNGYLALAIIKQLLEKGYHVNATVRNPDDSAKVAYLKKIGEIGTLKLFQADMTVEGSFDDAVIGCDYVFQVAAPTNLMSEDPENDLIKPAIQGTLNILRSCLKAKTVKRVVHTSSACTVSVNQQKGTGYVLNEEAWSDIDYMLKEKPPTWGYIVAKTRAEKEAFKFAKENKIDLITINPTFIIGIPLNGEVPPPINLALCFFTGDKMWMDILKMTQMISGSVSAAHLEDTARAHIFLAENDKASGRYICNAVNTSAPELASFLNKQYPQYKVFNDVVDLPGPTKLSLSSEKLIQAGFEFKYKSLEEIIDSIFEYGKSKGFLSKRTPPTTLENDKCKSLLSN
ncbi:anthocyanidin reductase ((2S)-flavan-3-ol-forming) isoform X2 [Dioscorea cayenensis subsp. rotundata]|uniref:Anthocyanidin reductase ((2S)-flavan-3-ol-forming) isoform X2 n=1 Tax=Dioscorea cayennensis subsp. rotundata TaxID=55577 RepID=A0AB40D389_DIOCR|nr:anthocyanidin reductase ((2S)-flavan-3-ol-forming) isoform X2 [Dioscorea cayenensis subsp. rotundata]